MEKLYHAVVFIGALCALVILGFVLFCVRQYTETFGQEFLIISGVMTICICGLLLFGSLQAGCWLQAKVNRAINHERLIVHQHHSFYLNEDGLPVYTGAIQESAKISTFALEQAQNQQTVNDAIAQTPIDLSEDSMAVKVGNLMSQNKSERSVAKQLGLTRHQVRQLKPSGIVVKR